MAELEPLNPADGKAMYLTQRESEVSESTRKAHDYRLKHFVRWCELENIDNLNELTARTIFEYRQWRKRDGDLNQVSLKTQLSTLKIFLRFCESIDAVEDGLSEKMMIPTLAEGEDTREGMLEAEQAQALLSHLDKFEYASTKHALVTVLWHTSCRIGGLHSLDIGDFDAESQSLSFEHRPDTGTSLKNGVSGERIVALSAEVTTILKDYIETNHPKVEDEYGREPLFATAGGRWHKSNIRQRVYAVTRPCYYTGECPHERDLDLCEANSYDQASKCPSSNPPHDIRRGSITHYLKDDVPTGAISDRANVSAKIMERHYNQMSDKEKMEQRREFFD